jgi:hypothetical protein
MSIGESKASERVTEVGREWAEIEELLLAEKVRVIEAVRNEPMHGSSRRPNHQSRMSDS